MAVKIIFLNGPPGSGKDFAAYLLKKNPTFNAFTFKYSDPLKVLTHHMFGIDEFNVDDPLAYERLKDQERVEFDGMTPRQAYILVDKLMKEKFGEDIWGRRLVKRLRLKLPNNLYTQYVAIPDSGFSFESAPVIAEFGYANCNHIRLARDGYSFINDSRSYWDAKPFRVKSRDVQNIGIPEPFEKELVQALKGF